MTDLSLTLTPLTPADLPAIDKLDDRAFGPGRFALAHAAKHPAVNVYGLEIRARLVDRARREPWVL